MISDHVWRPPVNLRTRDPRACFFMNCGRPAEQHARAVTLDGRRTSGRIDDGPTDGRP